MTGNSIALGQDVTHDTTFDVLFNVHHDYVYRLAHALLGHAQDAEDVTQEVFLRVYKGLPGYQPERAGLRTWITQVAVNTCQRQRRRNFVRRLWHSPPPVAEDGESESLDLADSSAWGAPEGQALQAELRRTVRGLLDRLRPEHRTILILHYYMDLSCPEIAQALNCAEGTVYSRLHYARRRLQTELEGRALSQQKVK